MQSFEHNKKLTVVNLLSGPGAGKSALAYVVTGLCKVKYHSVEYVHEYAKEMVWSDMGRYDPDTGYDSLIFSEQDWMLANQHRLQRRLIPKDIDLAITDTSLLLGILYAPDWYPDTYEPFMLDIYNSYTNVNIFVDRGDIPYQWEGRNQTLEESIAKDEESLNLLKNLGLPYHTVTQKSGDIMHAANQVMDIIANTYALNK